MKSKIIHALLLVISSLTFIGCSQEKQVVYVDQNGTPIPQPKQYRTVNPNIVCDTRGYAFYVTYEGTYGMSMTPVLVNYNYGADQVKCNDLE